MILAIGNVYVLFISFTSRLTTDSICASFSLSSVPFFKIRAIQKTKYCNERMLTVMTSGLSYPFNWLFGVTQPGPGPINILQHKFYTMLIFKHSDWILKFVNQ